MIFIPLINILNISIILMTIIVFFNYSSARKPTPLPTLFQLVKRSDTNYFVYSARTPRSGEKKLSIYEFFLSKHNLEARRIPLPTDKSLEDQKKRINRYCKRIPGIPYNSYIHDFNVYYQPAFATNNHCDVAFGKLTSTLFTCLSSVDDFFDKPATLDKKEEEEIEPATLDKKEEEEIEPEHSEPLKSYSIDEENKEIELLKKQFEDQIKKSDADFASFKKTIERVPTALSVLLKNALNNDDEPNAAKTKCCSTNNLKFLRKFFYNKDSLNAEEVIKKIGKIYEKHKEIGVEKETKFYMCILNFKNGVTELNKAIGKYTPERISKKDLKTLDPKYKKIYDRQIIILDDNNSSSPQKRGKCKMSLANKKKILEMDEITFLKEVGGKEFSMNVYNTWKSDFIGNYKVKENVSNHDKDIENTCINGIEIMDQLNFKVTKLSYMIYPNKWEDQVHRCKKRKNTIIKNLKLLDKNYHKNPKNNNSGKKEETNNNHIYESYENENNKMDESYFKRLKLCRAIPGEAYDTYVIRLNNNDCVPLHKDTWNSEIIDMKSFNDINITNLSEFSEMKVNS